MRKSLGHISWVRILKLTVCEEDPPKLYKIDIATELVKQFLNGKLVKMVFFFPKMYTLYIQKEQFADQKMT
jgi:Gpi18-like mannosyltransferase